MSDESGSFGAGLWWRRECFQHAWSEKQSSASVPYKELWPIVQFLDSQGHRLRGKILVCLTDSMTNVYAFATGSSSSAACARLLRRASRLQIEHDMEVFLLWCPREFNVVADMSKNSLPGRPF